MNVEPTLTVVIPVLNAAESLALCLASLAPGMGMIGEIIVVDGGSTDGTRSKAAGVKILSAPASRGGQFSTGIAAATGAFLLLLHADSVLSPDWLVHVKAAMQRPDYAHYFRFRLDSPARMARLLEAGVALRCRYLRLPYGDQGLLISRTLLDSVGGMPDLPLMEDVELVRRLKRRLRPLPAISTTSARRYERDGWLRRPLRNLFCLGLFYCGVPPARIKMFYG
jgi:rSAM/selenodomain-associated transferase 2